MVRDQASGAESAFRSGIYALAFLVIEILSFMTADVSIAFTHAPVETDACDLVLLPGNITMKGQRVILWLKKAMNGLRRARCYGF